MKTNLPVSFCEQMKPLLQTEHEAFCHALSASPTISIRVNPKKKYPICTAERVPWSKYGFYLSARPQFVSDPLWHAGTYYVQEASSMFLEQVVMQLFSNKTHLNILDVCAAPGGKSLHLLSLLDENSLVVANETIATRNVLLCENIVKWGYPNIIVTRNDPRDFGQLPAFFDLIVADVPCSGEGMCRKDPSIWQTWNNHTITHCVQRQRRIVQDILPALKTGGILIYSTCTFNIRENEEQIAHFIQQYALEPVSLSLDTTWNISLSSVAGAYRFYPHRLKGEGFFIAVLRKTNPDKQHKQKLKTKSQKNLKKHITPVTTQHIAQLNKLICQPEIFNWYYHHPFYCFFPQSKQEALFYLMPYLNVIRYGTEAAAIKSTILPQHALAMSIFLQETYFDKKELSTDEALRYLSKEVPAINGKDGWLLITYQHVPLGFVKKNQHRCNNYYPSAWRLRKKIVSSVNRDGENKHRIVD